MNHLNSLRKPTVTTLPFWAWKPVVKIGVLKSYADYRRALAEAGVLVDPLARELLEKMPITETETELELVVPSVFDLGFNELTHWKNICARAFELGFEFCPAQVGPALRLQYSTQPDGEATLIAMEPLRCRFPFWQQHIFFLQKHGNLPQLNGVPSPPRHYWYPFHHVAFVYRKK